MPDAERQKKEADKRKRGEDKENNGAPSRKRSKASTEAPTAAFATPTTADLNMINTAAATNSRSLLIQTRLFLTVLFRAARREPARRPLLTLHGDSRRVTSFMSKS